MRKGLVILLILLVVASLVAIQPFTVSAAADNFWITKAPMPEVVGNLGTVTLGNKIYAIAADVTYEYTPSTNTWVTKTPMPTPRSSFGIAAVGDKIFVIGGLMDDNLVTDVNEVYDSVTDSWETLTPMPTARWALEANTVSNKIFLIGGNGGRNISEVYDPSTDSWSTSSSPLTPINMYASVVFENKIYIIGGHEGGGVFGGRVQIYDPETDFWSYGQSAPQKVISAAAGVTSGALASDRIYVLGVSEYIGVGANFGQQVPDVINQVFYPKNNSWSVGASPAVNRLGMGVAVVEAKLYAIGGYTYESEGRHVPHEPSAINEEYTPFYNQLTEGNQFLLTLVWVAAGLAVVVGVILIVYFKRRR